MKIVFTFFISLSSKFLRPFSTSLSPKLGSTSTVSNKRRRGSDLGLGELYYDLKERIKNGERLPNFLPATEACTSAPWIKLACQQEELDEDGKLTLKRIKNMGAPLRRLAKKGDVKRIRNVALIGLKVELQDVLKDVVSDVTVMNESMGRKKVRRK